MVQQHQEIQMLETRLVDRAKKTTVALAIGSSVVGGVIEILLFLMQILNPAMAAILFVLTISVFPLVALWILPWISDIERYRFLCQSQPHQEYGPQPYVPGRDD